jgi:hypothetical protein
LREQQNRSRRLHDCINVFDRLWFRHRFEPRVDHGPTALLVLGQNSRDIALQPTHFRPEQVIPRHPQVEQHRGQSRSGWLLAGDAGGGIYRFGDARLHGSLAKTKLTKSIVAMAIKR